MEIKSINKGINIEHSEKQIRRINQFEKLIELLRLRSLKDNSVSEINNHIDVVNNVSNSNKEFRKQVRRAQSRILKFIEKEEQLVTKDHYRNTWMALGIAFGAGLGAAFSSSIGNFAFTGVGIPIGMVIGMAIGAGKDKKAKAEGRQLDMAIK